MSFKLKIWLNVLVIIFHQYLIIEAKLYVFLLDDPSIFTDCKNEPDYLGVADIIDLSNLYIEFFDESVHMEGSFTMVWDALPSDRIELRVDIWKYERGSWQPTSLTMIEADFCKTIFNENTLWYSTWGKYVDKNDLKCINNKGHTYHHKPFDVETVANLMGENTGRHKVVIKLHAYNQFNERQPYSVCLEVVGDIMRKYQEFNI